MDSPEKQEISREDNRTEQGKTRHAGQFKPGQSGNPNGRPKLGNALSDLLRGRFDEEQEPGVTKGQAIADKLIELSLAGDVSAIRLSYDRVDGSPAQSIKHTGSPEEPIHVRNSPRPSVEEPPDIEK